MGAEMHLAHGGKRLCSHMNETSASIYAAPPQAYPDDLPRPLWPSFFPWVLIIAAILGSLFMQYGVSGVKQQKAEMSLDVLRIQALLVIGMERLMPGTGVAQLPQLEQMCKDPRSFQAVAALHKYLKPDDTDGAVALIDPGHQHGPLVIKAIEQPAQVNGGERDTLKKHLGWFASLLSAAENAKDPLHDGIHKSAKKATLGYFAILGIGSIAAFAGLILLVWAIVGVLNRRFPLRLRPTNMAPLLLEGFALYLFSFVFLQALGALLKPPMWASVLFMLFSFSLGLCWPVLRGLPFKELCWQLGLTRGAGLLREIGFGLVGYVAMLPLFVIGVVCTVILQALTNALGMDVAPPTHPAVSWATNGGLWLIVMTFLLAAVAAPLTEETMFRGALLHGLRRHLGLIAAGLLMGLIFAVVHPQGWLAIPPLMLLGFGFGLLREWRGSLIAPITAHALHNGMLVLVMSALF